jgi:hypothetical protein
MCILTRSKTARRTLRKDEAVCGTLSWCCNQVHRSRHKAQACDGGRPKCVLSPFQIIVTF